MEISFSYRSNIQDIPRLRKDLSNLASSWKIPESEFRQIGVIIEELLSNIIRFAYNDNNEHPIDVRIGMSGKIINIQIVDDGVSFNPTEYHPLPNPDPAASDTFGMGLVLVKTFSDSLNYFRKDDKNHLEITKTLRSNSDP